MNPFGWLFGAEKHLFGQAAGGWAHIFGRSANGWFHIGAGGAKAALGHLSLAQLFGVLLAVLGLVWQAVLGAFPQLDHAVHGLIHPSAYNCPATDTPVGGAVGIGYKLGADLRVLTGPPPSAQSIHDGLVGAFTTAGEIVGAFTAAAHGATAPPDPAGVPPSQQVGLTSCCPPPTAGIPAGSTDTAAVVAAKAAIGAGFPTDQLVTAVAVAGAESGWNPTATHVNLNGSIDRGEWQINSVHADLLALGDWRDPLTNGRMAAAVWKSSGWPAWSTYNSGAYQGYVGAARTAVARAQGQLGPYLPVSITTTPAAQTCTPAVPVSTAPGVTATVAFALAQVGKPYVWGAAPMPTPSGPVPTSYDCSSLVQSALLAGGIALPGRQTTRTLIGLGVEVPASDIQAGDLVFPDSGHVVLAIGGGRMVEAPQPGQTVRVGPLYGAWRVRRLTTPLPGGPAV